MELPINLAISLSRYPVALENRREARKLGPVSKPNASINQPAQRARGGGSMSFARGGGDVSPGNLTCPQ